MATKCAAFWKHTNIRGDNRVFPCCRFKTPIATFDGDLEQVLHIKEYEDLRNADVSKLSQCSKCMHEEANGKKSLRQEFNEQYDTDSIGIEFLEIGFDNICNLTCDGCWSEFSSAWAKKENVIHYTSINEIHNVPNTIKKVLFLGGEPLMTNRHKHFLTLIEDPSNVEIIYNTNGTFLLDDALVDKLKEFKLVTFILSIDGYKELNNRVRSGSNWEDILKFISQIKDLGFILEVNTVLHVNNWHGIKDLEQFVNELAVDWTVNVLTYPKHLDIATTKNPRKILDLIKETNIPNKEYVLNHIKAGILQDYNSFVGLEQTKEVLKVIKEDLKTFDYKSFIETVTAMEQDRAPINSPSYFLLKSCRSQGYLGYQDSVSEIEKVVDEYPEDTANWLCVFLYDKGMTINEKVTDHFKNTKQHITSIPGVLHLSLHFMEDGARVPPHTDNYDEGIVSILYTINLSNPEKYILYVDEEKFYFEEEEFFSFRPEIEHRVDNDTGDIWVGMMIRVDKAYLK